MGGDLKRWWRDRVKSEKVEHFAMVPAEPYVSPAGRL